VTGRPRQGLLTDRQLDVLDALSHGLSNAAVGALLGIATSTVRHTVQTMLEDLGATDRAHAVRIGFEEGLLSATPDRRPRTPRKRRAP
jgi:DNA-binding NarL/FixJ family response regulator